MPEDTAQYRWVTKGAPFHLTSSNLKKTHKANHYKRTPIHKLKLCFCLGLYSLLTMGRALSQGICVQDSKLGVPVTSPWRTGSSLGVFVQN